MAKGPDESNDRYILQRAVGDAATGMTERDRSEANANVNVSAYLPEGSAHWKQWLSSKRHLFGTGWLDESVFDAAGLLGADIDD